MRPKSSKKPTRNTRSSGAVTGITAVVAPRDHTLAFRLRDRWRKYHSNVIWVSPEWLSHITVEWIRKMVKRGISNKLPVAAQVAGTHESVRAGEDGSGVIPARLCSRGVYYSTLYGSLSWGGRV